MPDLHVKRIPSYGPACESGRHVYHPMETCDEYEALCRAFTKLYEDALTAAFSAHLTQMSEVPAALRGPNWQSRSY